MKFIRESKDTTFTSNLLRHANTPGVWKILYYITCNYTKLLLHAITCKYTNILLHANT